MRDVEVRAGGIDLGQLMKFAGLVDTGGDAKALLAEGVVLVNGEVTIDDGHQTGRHSGVLLRGGVG